MVHKRVIAPTRTSSLIGKLDRVPVHWRDRPHAYQFIGVIAYQFIGVIAYQFIGVIAPTRAQWCTSA